MSCSPLVQTQPLHTAPAPWLHKGEGDSCSTHLTTFRLDNMSIRGPIVTVALLALVASVTPAELHQRPHLEVMASDGPAGTAVESENQLATDQFTAASPSERKTALHLELFGEGSVSASGMTQIPIKRSNNCNFPYENLHGGCITPCFHKDLRTNEGCALLQKSEKCPKGKDQYNLMCNSPDRGVCPVGMSETSSLYGCLPPCGTNNLDRNCSVKPGVPCPSSMEKDSYWDICKPEVCKDGQPKSKDGRCLETGCPDGYSLFTTGLCQPNECGTGYKKSEVTGECLQEQ